MKPLRLMPSTLIFVSAAMLFGGDDPLMHSVSFGSCRIGVQLSSGLFAEGLEFSLHLLLPA